MKKKLISVVFVFLFFYIFSFSPWGKATYVNEDYDLWKTLPAYGTDTILFHALGGQLPVHKLPKNNIIPELEKYEKYFIGNSFIVIGLTAEGSNRYESGNKQALYINIVNPQPFPIDVVINNICIKSNRKEDCIKLIEDTFPKLLLNKTVKNNYETVSYQSDFLFDFDWKKNEEVFVEVAIEIIYNDKREKKTILCNLIPKIERGLFKSSY